MTGRSTPTIPARRPVNAALLLLLSCLTGRASAQAPDADGTLTMTEPAAPTPAVEATNTLSASEQTELAALLAQPATIVPASDGPSLHLYGFGDMLVMKSFPKRSIGVFPPKSVIMAVGNVNLYAAADLTHGLSSLLEVRFTYLPNGSIDPNSFEPVNTTVFDYADWNRPTQWGGIVLERFHLDYSYSGLLNLRLGQFLTPYGIWNVDHGSPTVIPPIKPYVIGEQLLPTRQTGFQLFGSTLLGETTLGYALTLSNGRGDIQYLDIDQNKALGFRLYASYGGLGELIAGFSGYTGISSREQRYEIAPGNPPTIHSAWEDSFRELAFGGDLLWEWRGFRFQAELIAAQRKYRDASRKLASGFGTRAGFLPDHVAWGTYALVAYRLPWFNVMPFFVVEHFDRGYARGQLLVFGGNTVNLLAVRGGLNVRPVPQLALKLQYSHIWFPGSVLDLAAPNLSFQAAWAF